MSSLQNLNSNAEVLRRFSALAMNINAAKGLQEVMRSNLGPKGTLKMYILFPLERGFNSSIGLSEVLAKSRSPRMVTFFSTKW